MIIVLGALLVSKRKTQWKLLRNLTLHLESQNRRQDKVPLKKHFMLFLFFPFSVSSAILGIVGLQTTLLTTMLTETFAFIPLLILGFIGFTRGEKEEVL
ncbi:MAG: hypothetical protein U0X93_08545 [Anaerolineales bacterium]